MSSGLQTKFDAMSKRERLLVTVTVLVAIVAIAFMLVIEPSLKRAQVAQKQQQELKSNISISQQKLELLTQKAGKHPNKELKVAINQLLQRRQVLDMRLQQLSLNLLAPEDMTESLRKILASAEGLELVALSNLPVDELDLQDDSKAESDQSEVKRSAVYKHGFVLQLRGGYKDIYQYLIALEGLSEGFFWRSLDYKVVEYPKAEVRLELYTLSTQEGWLGA